MNRSPRPKRKKPFRKKSSAKTLLKKAFNAAERALIAAVNRRDGSCKLCGSTEVLQADHCFSRTVKALFFDIRNLTLLCRSCHTKKTYKVNGWDKKVDEFVRNREGGEWWLEALQITDSQRAYKHSLEELEQITVQLNGMFLTAKAPHRSPARNGGNS